MRIGNAAVDQLQLDVYGEVMDAITLGRQAGLRFDSTPGACCGSCCASWRSTGTSPTRASGRSAGRARHFVHSKVMAWVAFDRAIRLVELGQPGPRSAGARSATRSTPRCASRATTPSRGTFTQYYGSTELDAAVLLIPEVGFLPPDDPRVVSTVRTIKRELMSDGLVLRYTQPAKAAQRRPADVDGLTGAEGAFLACSFWLVNALHLIGEHDDAVEHLRAAADAAQRRRPAERGVRPPLRPPGRATSRRPSATCR